ncbi:MAG: 50S ribosomal protein L3 N(5)-glutamine methyltransferase [Gammaproteobacteria bacterium]|jgi:ribosomal protein L3 glutamine methyltransferase|nr:50S ribosomal protein L3 N(5)-glutamine methyltransferase [Gammaproteobacteria bacterium]
MSSDSIPAPTPITVEELIRQMAEELDRSGVFLGHGTDDPIDEAAFMVFHVMGLDHAEGEQAYIREVPEEQRQELQLLLRRRIQERIPAAYLLGKAWFCGLDFYVDERVLVPRSPIAELIGDGFQPWIDPIRVRRVLDLCTGSGCIGIAAAMVFPEARVDLADLSFDALEVARINVEHHALGQRVSVLQGDLFGAVGTSRYDVIVSNPPYVAKEEFLSLPEEYGREPSLGLVAGEDGLDLVRSILAEAADHLEPGGILVVEVGSAEQALERAFPGVPFTWLDFEYGGSGVFTLTRDELLAHQGQFVASRKEPGNVR